MASESLLERSWCVCNELLGKFRLIKLSMRDLSVEADLGKSEVPRTVSDFLSLTALAPAFDVVVVDDVVLDPIPLPI